MSNHLFGIIADTSHPASHKVVQFPDGSAWTRAQLLERTARYANVLESLGVAPGDRICLQIEKSVETMALTLGAVRAGAVFVPLQDQRMRYETQCLWKTSRDSPALSAFVHAVQASLPIAL